MRKSLYLLLLMSLVLLGCGSGPKETISKYLTAYYKLDSSKAYELLSSEDKKTKTLSEFQGELSSPLAAVTLSKATFKIKNIKSEGKMATVVAEIKMPDYSSVMSDIMASAFSSVFGGKDSNNIEKDMAEKLKGKDVPLKTVSETYELRKEKDGWRVFMNWQGQKKAEELVNQAEKLEKTNKLEEAKAMYLQASALDKNNSKAKEQLAGIDKKISEFKAKKDYFSKIEIRELSIGRGTFGERGVFGEVKNMGDRTLKEVEVAFYCLDKDNKVIFEKTYHPVLVSEYSFMKKNTPLKPNYSRKFGCKLDDAPSDWAEVIKAEVINIEFE